MKKLILQIFGAWIGVLLFAFIVYSEVKIIKKSELQKYDSTVIARVE